MSETPQPSESGMSRRTVLAGAGAASITAILADFGIVLPAFGATLGDPWADYIASYNWDWMEHRINNPGNPGSGGQDYAFGFGDEIFAPAAGTLGTGSGGNVTFTLDETISRVAAAEDGELGDTLAALGFMHLSAYGAPGHYNEGEGPIAYVGNTGGVPAHLHVHGYSTTSGHKVDWRKFISGSGTSEEQPMAMLFNKNGEYVWALAGLGQGEAGWIETTDSALATKLSLFLKAGPTVTLTLAQWTTFKGKFEAQY